MIDPKRGPLKVVSNSRVPFNDLSIQWNEIAEDVRHDFEDIFSTSAFSLGPYAEKFERHIASYLGTKHAIGVNSGTSALHLAVLAAGIGPGDEVLVPSHTFIATAWGPIYAGAAPVFCDVDHATGTIDLRDAELRVTSRTKAVIPVHLYGQPASMDQVSKFARRHALTIIEDNAQAVGARWNGRALGTIGQLGCFSFYPGKNLGAAGEGGLVVTDDDELAAKMRSLRSHGQRERYIHQDIGFNYRIDGLQAAVLDQKLRHIDRWTARRRAIADTYLAGLKGLDLDLPYIVNQDHVWHLFVVRTPRRDELRHCLTGLDIETGLHYPVPCHRQPCLKHMKIDRDSFPNSDAWATRGLTLPLFYGMTDEQVQRVIGAVRDFFDA
jgi:dTDP-4-amino-4,6-dideoxygalactose transaminase